LTTPPDNCLPPPQICEKLENIVARFGGTLKNLPDIAGQTYFLPSRAPDEFRRFFQDTCQTSPHNNFIARLPGGRVFGSGCILSPDGKSIARDVSIDFGKTFHEHWLLGYPKMRPAKVLSGITAVIATTLGSGYSHWLLEELPRLLALKDISVDRLIAHSRNEYNQTALKLGGYAGEVLEPLRFSHHVCETLLVPGLSGEVGNPSFVSVQAIHDFTAPLHEKNPPSAEKIYISRSKARRRRITLESALIEALEKKGFGIVHPETMNWKEQINLFRHAKVIVTAHGAALANLVFCRPGTKVIELFNRRYLNGCYWKLASVRKLEYHPVFPPLGEPLSGVSGNNRLDITYNLKQVTMLLD